MDGAWFKIWYEGGNEFEIKVKDLHVKKVIYPVPATHYDFVLNYLPPEYHDYTTHTNDFMFQLMERWELTLTHKQATKNNMVKGITFHIFTVIIRIMLTY